MANPTYVLINSYTVTSGGTSSVTFSSIPATYTDLAVKCSVRAAGSGTTINQQLNFNGDFAGNYTSIFLEGTGSSAVSYKNTGYSFHFIGNIPAASATSSTFGNCEVYVPNYISSNQKSISSDSVTENNGTTANQDLSAGLWTGTSAITSLTLTCGSGNYVQYSTFYLYGINNS